MQPLWAPSATRIAQSEMTRFQSYFSEQLSVDIPDYATLHHLSVTKSEAFWSSLMDFYQVIGEGGFQHLGACGQGQDDQGDECCGETFHGGLLYAQPLYRNCRAIHFSVLVCFA